MGSSMDSRYYVCKKCFVQLDWEKGTEVQDHRCDTEKKTKPIKQVKIKKMYKYVVALYSNFDGSMIMDEVLANSQVQAGKLFLASEGENTYADMANVNTYEQLQQYVFDQDHAIGVHKVETGIKHGPATPVAQLLKH